MKKLVISLFIILSISSAVFSENYLSHKGFKISTFSSEEDFSKNSKRAVSTLSGLSNEKSEQLLKTALKADWKLLEDIDNTENKYSLVIYTSSKNSVKPYTLQILKVENNKTYVICIRYNPDFL